MNPNPDSVTAEVSGLIERIKPYKGVMLAGANVTPRETPPENFWLIGELVEELGTYR